MSQIKLIFTQNKDSSIDVKCDICIFAVLEKAKFKNYPNVMTALEKIKSQLDSNPVNSIYSALIIPHFPKSPETLSLRNIILDW